MEKSLTFTSYAKNLEDVILWRVLNKFSPGFYIDVGACDPIADSVTKSFYDAGWHGINIEPMNDAFERIVHARHRDINLKMALGAKKDNAKIFCIDNGKGLSTLKYEVACKYIKEGLEINQIDIQVETLARICKQFAQPQIHFLKIDVEGGELGVLEGADFTTYRPWIILVKSTEPNTSIPSYSTWEPILLNSGYSNVYFDGMNKFYVANEKMGAFSDGFSCPPNQFDCYQRYDFVKLSADFEQTKRQLDSLAKDFAIYKARVECELDACYQELYESSRHIGVLARTRDIDVTKLKNTVAGQRNHIKELEKQLADLYDSNSWRVTKPLRFLFRLMAKAGFKK